MFLGTIATPRLEQSTLVPTQVHILGHLIPVNDKCATSSACASQENEDNARKHPTKANGIVVIARMVFPNCLFTSKIRSFSLFVELIEILVDYEENEVGQFTM